MSIPNPRRWLILWVVLAAECMDLMDGTIVNTAAPSIRGELHTSLAALQWIVGGYALALAVGLVVGGRLGDRFGRRRLFLIGAAGFTVSSVLAGLAPNTGALVAFRLAQGLAAALMLPQGFGLIREAFGAEMGKAFAVFGPVMGSAAILGPIVGGGLVDLDVAGVGWRSIFFVNLPLGAAALYGAAKVVPESRAPQPPRLDLVGAFLVSIAGVLAVYPLIQGREHGWPAWSYGMMAASVALLGVFAVHIRRRDRAGRDPIVTPSVFSKRGYTGGLLVLVAFFSGMIGMFLTLMLYLQAGHGFGPAHAGLTLVPFSLGTAIASGVSGGYLGPKIGRACLQLGIGVGLGGVIWLISTVHGAGAHVTLWDLAPSLFTIGVGFGLLIVPLFDVILAAVDHHEAGSASGVLNALQQLASAMGVAVIGTVFFSEIAHGGFGHALETSLWVQAALLVAALVFTPLLPRKARAEEWGGDEAAAAPQAA
jgi:EmrB/QacA subfamily drug resistance transporter